MTCIKCNGLGTNDRPEAYFRPGSDTCLCGSAPVVIHGRGCPNSSTPLLCDGCLGTGEVGIQSPVSWRKKQ